MSSCCERLRALWHLLGQETTLVCQPIFYKHGSVSLVCMVHKRTPAAHQYRRDEASFDNEEYECEGDGEDARYSPFLL